MLGAFEGSGNSLSGLLKVRETMKYFSQDSPSPFRDSNPGRRHAAVGMSCLCSSDEGDKKPYRILVGKLYETRR
jgi:hypothetical protein